MMVGVRSPGTFGSNEPTKCSMLTFFARGVERAKPISPSVANMLFMVEKVGLPCAVGLPRFVHGEQAFTHPLTPLFK